MSDLWEEGPEEYYGMLDIEDDDQATPPIDSKGVAELAELIGAFSHCNPAKAKRLKVLLAQEVNQARIQGGEAELQRLYERADSHGIVQTSKSSLYKRMMEISRKAGLV